VVGAPRWKGTVVAEEVADLSPVGCTMTCVAVMVVPLTVPSTRTVSPVVMALAEVAFVAFLDVVAEASLTVTCCPGDVDSVKLDAETVPTVPTAPPAAGPDRALDPLPPDPRRSVALLPGPGCPDVVEGDVVQPAESWVTAHISAATTIRPLVLFGSSRRILGRRACVALVPEADQPGDDTGGGGGAAPSGPGLAVTDGPGVALMAGLRENMGDHSCRSMGMHRASRVALRPPQEKDEKFLKRGRGPRGGRWAGVITAVVVSDRPGLARFSALWFLGKEYGHEYVLAGPGAGPGGGGRSAVGLEWSCSLLSIKAFMTSRYERFLTPRSRRQPMW
jgi:hypothetical protein